MSYEFTPSTQPVRASVHPAAEPRLNPDAVLAALDEVLAPSTLHRSTRLGTMRLKMQKLRAHVAEYVQTNGGVE